MKKWIEKFDRFFAAVTFAEANCHDIAMEFLNHKKDRGKNKSLSMFLENVGLNNVNVRFVTATI